MKILNDGTKPVIVASPGYMGATPVPPGGELAIDQAVVDAGFNVQTQAEAGSSFPDAAGGAAAG